MTILRINTNEIIELSKQLSALSTKYNNQITSFYERINAIDGKTNEWKGEDAKKFISNINNSRKAYELVGSTIRQYSDILFSFASDVDLVCTNNKIE